MTETSDAGGWTFSKAMFLGYMSMAYIIGEIAHFMINTTSREVAQDIQFGDQNCFANQSIKNSGVTCSDFKNSTICAENAACIFDYSGTGYEYQILAGPAFVAVFTVSGLVFAIASDYLYDKFSRTIILALGTFTFSAACVLMGFTNAYWQLVVLRGLIAMGESVCRPVSSALIAEIFNPTSRGLANGILSWGVYYGYGLAYVYGIYITNADILGYSWRASYIIAGAPGFIIGLLLCTQKDPRMDMTIEKKRRSSTAHAGAGLRYWKRLASNCLSLPMVLLMLSAFARHTAGLSWAYNTRNYFQHYHPDFDITLWILCASVVGGSFGVFAGGYFSDRMVRHFGLASRLWFLSACTLLAAPLAVGTLYFKPPEAMYCLIAYYFFAETWFAILFTVIVEIVDVEVRSTCVALFLFGMNQVGGNLPTLVTSIRKSFADDPNDFRYAMYVMFPGCLTLSAVLFLITSIPLYLRQKRNAEHVQIREYGSDEIQTN
jgi:MFS family permease